MRILTVSVIATLWINAGAWPSALAATPETFIRINDGALRVQAGRPVRLTLQTPERQSWSAANVGQIQVRTYGKAETIQIPADRLIEELSYTFEKPGFAMLLLAAGPGASKGLLDSVQRTPYCAKLLVRVDEDANSEVNAAEARKSPGLTAKAGMKVEVSPYIDPTSFSQSAIRNGADLPVRAYFEGAAQKNVAVIAYAPDGTRIHRTTDSVGIAHFLIDQPGRWMVRYRHVDDGVTYTGDLLFEIGVDSQRGRK